jgi:hypothetical protein
MHRVGINRSEEFVMAKPLRNWLSVSLRLRRGRGSELCPAELLVMLLGVQ